MIEYLGEFKKEKHLCSFFLSDCIDKDKINGIFRGGFIPWQERPSPHLKLNGIKNLLLSREAFDSLVPSIEFVGKKLNKIITEIRTNNESNKCSE